MNCSCNIWYYSQPKLKKFKNASYLCNIFVFYIFVVGILISVYLFFNGDGMKTTDRIESAVTFKVFGLVETNYSTSNFKPNVNKDLYNRVWDPADYVDISSNELFIMTNVIIQPKQKKGACAEDQDIPHASCSSNITNDCKVLGVLGDVKGGNGIPTGKCIQSKDSEEKIVNTCEIIAWCPVVREDQLPLVNNRSLLNDVKESKVMISNSVNFPELQFSNINYENILKCNTNETFCPIRTLGDILSKAKLERTEEEILKYGAILKVDIHWNCYKDRGINKIYDKFDRMSHNYPCQPKYVIGDFPNPEYNAFEFKNFKIFETFNADHTERTITKAYGIRIIVNVTGLAEDFDIFQYIKEWIKLFSVFSAAIWIFSFLLRCCRKKVL